MNTTAAMRCDAMRDAQVQERDVREGTALDARYIHACRDSRYSRAAEQQSRQRWVDGDGLSMND